ncbi:hypothetical protein HanXRQr2_Chr09g0373761 [Helianthus annuus]|uniref:Uncharacterized protein n=1 Tax=Helianthus annuus TaxID=4232 RepID=A0A9K3I393_HELAN|nr:hypothetical protein HanXRQr2_Chr09g0373761 [Helianthus annuus]
MGYVLVVCLVIGSVIISFRRRFWTSWNGDKDGCCLSLSFGPLGFDTKYDIRMGLCLV